MIRNLLLIVSLLANAGLMWALADLSTKCSDQIKDLKRECQVVEIKDE